MRNMKYIIFCFSFFSSLLFAEQKTEVKFGAVQKEVLTIDDSLPPEFVGHKIMVEDKNGKSAGEFDRKKWRIVPRDKKVVYKQTKYVSCKDNCSGVEFKHHTLSLLLGQGKTGLETKAKKDQDLEITQKTDLIYGAQYTYHLDNEWSFSGTVISNDSFLVGAGYSFNL
jgi:hypothetical protein